MDFSKIALSIGESATLKLNAQAAALKAQGEPLIHLAGGEPISKAPEDAIKRAIEVINTGEVRYSPASGIPSVKKAIIHYTKEFYGVDVEASNVIVSTGAKQSIMVGLQAILNPDDEVIFPIPYWVSYPDMVKLCGAKPVPVKASDGSLIPSINDFINAITPKTKAILLNSPNNPTGLLCPEQLIADIVRLCEKKDIYLIMDDIYHRLIFDGAKPISCYKFSSRSINESNIIVINGVSKQYAMTGFRIGWAIGNKDLIKVMGNIQGHQTSGAATPSQYAAEAAVLGSQQSVFDLCESLQKNRDVMFEQLKKIKHLRFTIPNGTFYCFVDFNAYNKNSSALSAFLLEKVKVLTMPGIEFGLDGYLRISTCGSTKDIIEGTNRIAWALDAEKGSEIQIGQQKVIKDW